MLKNALWSAAVLVLGCSSDPQPTSTPAPDASTETSSETGAVEKFSDLYRDLFSNETGVAKCQNPTCHGGATGTAGLAMGATKDDMYKAITSFNPPSYPPNKLVEPVPGGDARPKSAILRVTNPSEETGMPKGIMPFLLSGGANRKLTIAEWRRIEAWLARGAPND